jgi:hypothetical protein
MLETQAYRAFSAHTLADLTGDKKDERFATKLENEFLGLRRTYGLVDEPFPVPETQVGNEDYAAWVKSMEGRF